MPTTLPTRTPILNALAELRSYQPAALYDGKASFAQSAAGASVSTWPDLSGNGRDLVAGTAPTVTATLNGLDFNGSSQYLVNNALGALLAGTQAHTVYLAAVYFNTSSHATETPWSLASVVSGNPIEFLTWTFNVSPQNYTRRNDANTSAAVNSTGTTPQLAIMTTTDDGATNRLYYNGALFGSPVAHSGAATYTRFALGALGQNTPAFYWHGTVYACVVYPVVHDAATVARLTAVLQARYADVLQPYAAFFGDSITAGTGASDAAHRWVTLVAAKRGYTTALNAGIGGTVLQNTVQNTVTTVGGVVVNNARDNYVTRIQVYRPQYLYILYGINDLRLNDAAFTAALYQNDLGEIVDGMITGGMAASNIVIGSPPYMDPAYYTDASFSPYNAASSTKYTDYIAAAAACASAKGCRYIDVYQWMATNGGTSLVSADHLHPNDAGHQAIANAFLSVI